MKLSGGLLAAAVLLAIGGVLLAYAAVQALSDEDPAPVTAEGTTLGEAVVAGEPATEPFVGLTATEITVGNEELEVVVANEADERSQGLRGREDTSPYDGMLFVYGADTLTSFTMSGVTAPLDIGFYAANGDEVDRLEMAPCPAADATCPSYSSAAPYRFAIETPAGGLPEGAVSG